MYRFQLIGKIPIKTYWIDSAVSMAVKDHFQNEEFLKLKLKITILINSNKNL